MSRRWTDFLRSVPLRVTGSLVSPKAERTESISARVKFPVDRELVSRQLREGERLRAAGIVPKAVRR